MGPARGDDRPGAVTKAPGAHGVQKRSVAIAGHRTSVSLEPAFWTRLREIAGARGVTLSGLIAEIDAEREGNLSSAIRVFILDWVRNRPSTGSGEAGTD